jgi:hypothetical protein
MDPDDLWEAVQLADRLVTAALQGHIKPEEDKENEILLRALLLFNAKFDHELEPDDERRTSDTRGGRRNVSARRMGN